MSSASPHRPPREGDCAPDFCLDSTLGHKVELSSFRGERSVLLAFFPLAFTRVCTSELCDLSADFDRFAATGVEVLPISVDSTATLREFKAKHGLRTEMLSDFRREASRAYGVLLEEYYYSNRAYFLIGTDGRVRWAHVEEQPRARRSNEEVLEQIARHT